MHSSSQSAGGSKAIAGSSSPRPRLYPHMLIDGGDFQQWSHAIDATLRRKRNPRLSKFRSEAAHSHKLDGLAGSNDGGKKASDQAFDLMLSYVHPTILPRIPDLASKEPWDLWKYLPIVSRPFRLMALPAELREKVFREALPKRPLDFYCHVERQINFAIPPLLHCNRQVRKEASAVYYSESRFCFDLGRHVGHHRSGQASTAVPVHVLMHHWTANILGESQKHLRHLKVSFEVQARLAHQSHHHTRSITIITKFNVDLKKKHRLDVQAMVGANRGHSLAE